LNIKTISIALVHAFVGWFLCAATIGIGMSVTTHENALYIHATLAPIFFFMISAFYFKKYGHLSPAITASVFIAFVIIVDFFVVALLINRSIEMFSSLLGTWIPFALIFLATYLAGILVTHKRDSAA
jgi:NADH:ubiquinone oxidoreductase subunit 6 (subunit J)